MCFTVNTDIDPYEAVTEFNHNSSTDSESECDSDAYNIGTQTDKSDTTTQKSTDIDNTANSKYTCDTQNDLPITTNKNMYLVTTDKESFCETNSELTDNQKHSTGSLGTDHVTTDTDLATEAVQQPHYYPIPDMTSDSITECQRHDNQLLPLITYLENGTLPKSQKTSRKILLEHSDYVISDGLLFHTRASKSQRTKAMCGYLKPIVVILYTYRWCGV